MVFLSNVVFHDIRPRVKGVVAMEAEGEESGGYGEVDDHGPRSESAWYVGFAS